MNVSLAQFGVRLSLGLCLIIAVAPRETNAQLSGLFQSVPGTLAAYQHQSDGIQTVQLPVDLTLIFSDGNPTSMLTATIFKPIIGAQADGTPIYPIAAYFPMRVTGTSQNGQDFRGDLLDTQYLFDWQIEPANEGKLLLNGHVFWAGGRIEVTTINNALLIPAVAGDYDRDGTVDAGDYVVWRRNEGTMNTLPNDPDGGTIGAAQYNTWRSHFGQVAGSASTVGSSLNAAIPEPTTGLLLLTGFVSRLVRRRDVRAFFTLA